REASDLFRMATFFVISGYFTAMVYTRRPGMAYAQSRALLLVVPLVSALIFVNPIANWLIYSWHNTPVSLYDYLVGGIWNQPKQGNGVWHLQLWFLFSLLVYALLTPLLVRLGTGRGWQALMDAMFRMLGTGALYAVALVTGATVLALHILSDLSLRQLVQGTPVAWISAATINYLPWFALGVFAFLDRRLFATLHRFTLIGLVLAAAVYAATIIWGDALPFVLERTLYWLSRSSLTLFLIVALFRLFERLVTRPSRWLSFAVDSAFSFYIFHFAVIFAVALLVSRWTGDVYLVYAGILLLAPPLTLAIHAFIIAPVPLLRLMFNGKRKPRAVAAKTHAVPEGS
ncbi:acyltransferase family protein, partial [Polymorphobacter sp.]|uniref:acyltransferase family protein n=1 Tax=Polymorphobacter sp. TaxID=1909290 RepID=UPI003F7017A7